jgi:hypothetical protein
VAVAIFRVAYFMLLFQLLIWERQKPYRTVIVHLVRRPIPGF